MSTHGLGTVLQLAEKIAAGRVLLLAGEETLLTQLPPGRWIGATAASFMTETGGVTDRKHIFYTDITEHAETVEIHHYDIEQMRDIGKKYPENGFAVVIVPGLSSFLARFAQEAQDYEGIYNAPLIGWVSGVHLSKIDKKTPKTFAGGPQAEADRAAVMIVSMPRNWVATINIVNLFAPDKTDSIEFSEDGFSTSGTCRISGKPENLAQYIAAHEIDTKLPLIADNNGAMVNVSIRSVDAERQTVKFFTPVFKNMLYHFAQPVSNYAEAFDQACAEMDVQNTVFSCNCILNFLYAELDGKHTGPFLGPMTFGEIAYTALNQTLAYLSIARIEDMDAGDLEAAGEV
jgi:hypothetical protein